MRYETLKWENYTPFQQNCKWVLTELWKAFLNQNYCTAELIALLLLILFPMKVVSSNLVIWHLELHGLIIEVIWMDLLDLACVRM